MKHEKDMELEFQVLWATKVVPVAVYLTLAVSLALSLDGWEVRGSVGK